METSDFKLSIWNWVVIFIKGKFGGGLASVMEYVLKVFNEKVLAKVAAADMRKYSGIVTALAEFGEKVLSIYDMDSAKRTALAKTVKTLISLAVALSDGKVTPAELEKAIADVVETIEAWKNLKSLKPNQEGKEDSSATADMMDQVAEAEKKA